MDAIQFENEMLPVILRRESFRGHIMHSEMSHWHDHIELIVVNKGTIRCKAAGSDFLLSTGDVCFINRHQLHNLESLSGKDSSYTVLIISSTLLCQNPPIYEKYIRPIIEDASFSHIRFESNGSPASQISDMVMQTADLISEKPAGYELRVFAAIYLILFHIHMAFSLSPAPHIVNERVQIQQRMAEYIYAHFDEPLSLNDIAASGNVSRSHCSLLFRQYTSLSPIRFLNKLRLELSAEMLTRENDSISSIAQKCGFSSQSYYTRLFVREYGTTPMTYRKNRTFPAEPSDQENSSILLKRQKRYRL